MAVYLVTGGAGFIGSKVIEVLLDQGHCVVGVDNLNDAYDVRLKNWRLSQLERREGFEFFQADITNREQLREVWRDAAKQPFDAIVNLAARAGIRQSLVDPWGYFDTNVTGTLNLLELCREHDVTKLILASSSSLYGKDCPRPFSEDAGTNQPLSPYAASKKAAEGLCYSYHHLYGVDVTVLRFFTVFGPAGRPDMSPFRFVQWISEGIPVKIYGDGSQERDFTFVDDIARGTVAALRPVGYEIINLGSDKPVVLNDFIRLVEEIVGAKAELVYESTHPADMKATWANIRKANKLLDWEPHFTFREGVERLVTWYQENRDWAKEIKTI